METLELKKMSLANIEDTLTMSEMEEIMAGSMSLGCGLAIAGTIGATIGFIGVTGGWGLVYALSMKGLATTALIEAC